MSFLLVFTVPVAYIPVSESLIKGFETYSNACFPAVFKVKELQTQLVLSLLSVSFPYTFQSHTNIQNLNHIKTKTWRPFDGFAFYTVSYKAFSFKLAHLFFNWLMRFWLILLENEYGDVEIMVSTFKPCQNNHCLSEAAPDYYQHVNDCMFLTCHVRVSEWIHTL